MRGTSSLSRSTRFGKGTPSRGRYASGDGGGERCLIVGVVGGVVWGIWGGGGGKGGGAVVVVVGDCGGCGGGDECSLLLAVEIW